MKAHPTKYHGILFRSRLEARWAAFFDLLGWDWRYEAEECHYDGWIADFVLLGKKLVLIEIKPDRTVKDLEQYKEKIEHSGCKEEVLILGGEPLIPEGECQPYAFGLLGEFHDEMTPHPQVSCWGWGSAALTSCYGGEEKEFDHLQNEVFGKVSDMISGGDYIGAVTYTRNVIGGKITNSRPFAAKPDYRYYATRLAATIARVTGPFGWDEKSLMSGVQQSSSIKRGHWGFNSQLYSYRCRICDYYDGAHGFDIVRSNDETINRMWNEAGNIVRFNPGHEE